MTSNIMKLLANCICTTGKDLLSHHHYGLCVCVCVSVKVTQLYLTLCNPMDCNLASSSVHGILQARILEWVPLPFSRGPSGPGDQTQDSCISGRLFTV